MSIYKRLNSTANRLIKDYGRSFTFTRITQGEYNAASGEMPETTSTYTANAVKDSYNSFERGDSSIQVNDIKLIAESSGNYNLDDLVLIEDQQYRIIGVDPIKPGATVVAYELQARK